MQHKIILMDKAIFNNGVWKEWLQNVLIVYLRCQKYEAGV